MWSRITTDPRNKVGMNVQSCRLKMVNNKIELDWLNPNYKPFWYYIQTIKNYYEMRTLKMQEEMT